MVGDREVAVGSRAYVHGRYPALRERWTPAPTGVLSAHVVIDGAHAGVIEFADRIRTAAADTIDALRREGIDRIIVLSGDDAPTTHAVAAAVGRRPMENGMPMSATTTFTSAQRAATAKFKSQRLRNIN